MKPTELAKTYLLSFFGEKDLDDMRLVLADDLKSAGPFHKFDTAEDYILSLQETMPKGAVPYTILRELENENSCCIVYESLVNGADEIMAQLFEISDNKIQRIRLVLDGTVFLEKE